tara:strand:- start:2954 stop:3850 length:897 start_codon:yes stop_codon:yes gene_type:complete
MSFIFGGGGSGGGGGGGATSGTQVSIAREAPEIEARKLSLYDQALKLAQDPVQLPGYQVAPPTQLEQGAFNLAGYTGVGSGAVTSGLGQLGTAMQAPTTAGLAPYMNPYQSHVTDEINRQAQMRQGQLGAEAVQSGAFGGARQGVASAELDRARLNQVGLAQAGNYSQALGAFQRQQATGLSGAQAYGQLGQVQQGMQQGDISSLMQAGGVQRQLGQQALEAQRMTTLQRQYEPYQRLEFMKGLMTNLPTGQSAVTATTAPGTNPFSQAVGTGIGAYAAYNMANRPQGNVNVYPGQQK